MVVQGVDEGVVPVHVEHVDQAIPGSTGQQTETKGNGT